MDAVRPSRILVCGRDPAALDDVRRSLTRQGLDAHCQLPGESPSDNLVQHQLAVVEASGSVEEALRLCRVLRGLPGDAFLPILFLTPDATPAARVAAFEAGADAYLSRPYVTDELLAQVKALLRIREVHDRLADRTAEIHRMNKRLQQAYKQIDQELELARRLQVSFLPQKLPEVPPARFAVHYLMCGQVGGDFYDVFRLDENHIGFYVADAMGHGVPASLLTIFVKKGVIAKEVNGKEYRLIPPGEVLQRLNRDLIDQALSDTPFITMVYGLLNHREGKLSFSRAGHPYPLYVPKVGDLSLLEHEGLLLGVFEAQFSDRTQQLAVGDKVLLYSDGIDSAQVDGHEPGAESLLACAARHRELPVQEFVESLARELFRKEKPPDDLTLLGVEMKD